MEKQKVEECSGCGKSVFAPKTPNCYQCERTETTISLLQLDPNEAGAIIDWMNNLLTENKNLKDERDNLQAQLNARTKEAEPEDSMSENETTTNYEYDGIDRIDIDELFTELVNDLCRLDMKYTFTTEEHDEILKRIQGIDEAVSRQLLSLKYELHAWKVAALPKNRVPAQA